MKQKLQKLLIAIAGLLISANAFAYDFEKDEIYYNILSETDRTVAVTYCYYSNGCYNYFSGNLIIPAKVIYNGKTYTVTSIGSHAYDGCTSLTSITIPNSVTSIGPYAFYVCKGLTSVTIPNSVTSIGDYAFAFCGKLTKVYITDLSAWCKIDFENVSSNPLKYSAKLILNGYGITSLVIPNDITEIKDYAFYHCDGLTSVTIPNSVTSIGEYAFCYCEGLTSVTIPNSVTSIGERAFFFESNNLTSIIVESGNSMYDSRDNCNAIVETSTNTLIAGCENSTIPNSVTSIGPYAFYVCKGLTSVTIPNSVTSIGEHAFDGCKGLTSVTIPNSVTSIGPYAFYGCKGLTSVTIPNSVTSIGKYALSNWSNIRTIYCQSATPPSYPSSFDDDVLMYSTLYVPTGCKSAYEAVDPWRNFWNIKEMEFNGIEDIVADGDEINVVANNGEIVVNGIENAMVEVYNINGQLVYSGNSTAIAVANKGIYIVEVSGKTFKIAL